MLNRAYSLLDIKQVSEDARIITGIATSPVADLMDDVVEPRGAEFKLPIPLLWQHDSKQPIGHVTHARVTSDGIEIQAQIAKVTEPGRLKDRIDESWQSLKHGLVGGLSIGFKDLETERIKDSKGLRFVRWLWLELSAVTIAANTAASIQTIKSLDALQRAATGRDLDAGDRSTSAGVTARSTTAVKATEAKRMKKTIAEQISAFEATRQSKAAARDTIMETAADKGETLDAAQTEEYDTLTQDIESVDAHLKRLRVHEMSNSAAAIVVRGADQEQASASRGGPPTRVQVLAKRLPPGTAFTRYVMACANARGNLMQAEQMVRGNEQWMSESPEIADIIKTAVTAGTTSDATWAGPLVNYQIMTSEFIEYLRPLTIIGRIPGLRRVPFKIKIPRQTGASTVNWVGEGKVKPLTSIAFDTVTLEHNKIAGIIPLTEELVRFSNPSAEALVREELAAAIVQFMDSQFVDPTKAATDVSPASITNLVSPTVATGTTAAALRADIKTMMTTFLQANQGVGGLVWLMTQSQALAISLMQNSLGQAQYPGITLAGGTLGGLPVVTSENIPSTGGSPTDGYPIILLQAPAILLADDGMVTIDASREASLQMETAPDSPATASTTLVSLWQHNMVALRAERYITWAKARSTAVSYISNGKYAE